MDGVASRVRQTFERGVWPFATFVLLLLAMAVTGLAGMPGTAASMGLAALAVMLVTLLAKPRPVEAPMPAETPDTRAEGRAEPVERPDAG